MIYCLLWLIMFGVLEICHILFQVYHVWRLTVRHDKCFAVIVWVWCFHNKNFIVGYIFCGFVCKFYFGLFLLVAILFFVLVQFLIISFLIIFFVLVLTWYVFLSYIFTVFLEISWFVEVLTFWYVHTFYMPEVLWLVATFPASRACTLVLGFYE